MLLTETQIADFQRDDARVAARPGRTSPPFPGHGKAPGDRLRPDWFPVVWPAA